MRPSAPALSMVICTLIVVLPLAVALGAVILRAACALFNWFVGANRHRLHPAQSHYANDDEQDESAQETWEQMRPSSRPDPSTGPGVPIPAFFLAMGIVFLIGLINWIVGLVIGFGTVTVFRPRTPEQELILLFGVNSLSGCISLLVQAYFLSQFLPTTFVKGILVSLCQLLIVILVVLGIFALLIPLSVLVKMR